ncbi:MAG: tetratricopeptide repeat protein [Elusimicrobia bacterium]|nr:tetratricopeptide repeat protein [Elusimicrobiota bacterium]
MIIFSRVELASFFGVLVAGGVALYPSEYTRGLMHRQEGDRGQAVRFFRDYLERNPYHKGATFALTAALEAAGRPEDAIGPMLAFYRHRRGDTDTGRAVLALLKRTGQEDRAHAFRWELFEDAKRLPVPPKRLLEELMYQAFQQAAARQDDRATLRALQALAELSGESESYLGEMLRLLMERRQLDQAIRLLEDASRRQPANVELRRTLVRVYRLKGDLAGALAELDGAIALEPKGVSLIADRVALLRELKRYPQAEADLRTLIRLEPSDASWQSELAQVLFDDKRPEDAFQLFESLIVRRPGDRERWWALIYALADRGLRPRAIERLRAYLHRFPGDDAGEDMLVYLYQQEGRLDDAIVVLKDRVVRAPRDPKRRRALISALIDEERAAEAVEHYKALVELEPHEPEHWQNYVYLEESQGNSEKAIAVLERYLKRFPNDVKAIERLATLYLDAGDRATAIRLLQSTFGPNANARLKVLAAPVKGKQK